MCPEGLKIINLLRPMKIALRPIVAADIGCSLAILQSVAHQPLSVPLVAFDIGVAHAVYGRDRLNDQIQGGVDDPLLAVGAWTTSLSWLFCSMYLFATDHQTAIPLLTILTTSYTRLKPALGVLKSLFIGLSWGYAITCIGTAAPDAGDFLYYSTIFAASSNVLDLKDVTEDAERNVNTIPVVLGESATYTVSALLAVSALSFHGFASPIDGAMAAFALFCVYQAK